MVKLIIEDDEGKTTVVPLIRDEITIGRKEGNTIRLTERNVSRRHARLVKQNGGAIFIEDLGSYNGIKVNGNRITGRVAVAEGDRIQIGDYVLGLKLEGAADLVSPEPRSTETKTLELRPAEAPTSQIDVTDVSAPAPEHTEVSAPDAKPRTADGVGRLVCVSTNFPGQEWTLDRSLVVIGRTEDNDVVVNHRSISRHHARIVEEHGRYTIVDLQSSNGVRVNGEEYGKVELRRGDLIDLGHVRLRFVAPGEDFVFSRDASVVDISKAGGGRGAMWVAAAVVLLLVGAVLVWKFVLPVGTQPPDPGTAAGSGRGSTSTGEGDQAQVVAEINGAVQSENWAAAFGACEKLRGAKRESLKAQCDRAAVERAARESCDKAYAAAVANQDLEAVRLWNKVPDGAACKGHDRDKIDKARERALTRLRADLSEAAEDHVCDKAKQLAATIKEIDPSDGEAEAAANGCSPAAVAENPEKKNKKPPRKIAAKKIEPPAVTQANQQAAKAQVEQLVLDAQTAYTNGNHAQASKLAKQVLKLQPGYPQAIQILGASACYLNNEAEARSAYDRLPTKARNLLRLVCQRVGINL